jgi:hypothetical protein
VLIGYFPPVSVLETLLLFAVPTAGLVLLVALAVVGPRQARRKRPRVGQWDYDPLWWTANPEGAHLPAPPTRAVIGERGGARGSW